MSHSSSLLPPWVGALLLAAVLAAVGAAVWRWRESARGGAWRRVAGKLGGTLESARPFRLRGRHRGYAAFLQEAVSYEDAVAYRHTRGALNVTNPAGVVMGLRHKSALEEFATRKDARPVETGDPDFDRAFFLLLTVPEHLDVLLPPPIRRSLRKYSDVEVYLRSTQIEWRRAGTLSSWQEIMALFDLLADMADVLETLPARALSLSQKLAEEALIENGL